MDKQEFIAQLRKKLSGLPPAEINERLDFYSEMIDDRMEEGLSEAEAVLATGSVDDISAQAIADASLSKIAQERIRKKRHLAPWEILLFVLGCPIWLSLLIAGAAVMISLYISLWAVFASFAGCCLAGLTSGTAFIGIGNTESGVVLLGAGLICAGLAILLFFACKAATKGSFILTKKLVIWLKKCFIRKEELL